MLNAEISRRLRAQEGAEEKKKGDEQEYGEKSQAEETQEDGKIVRREWTERFVTSWGGRSRYFEMVLSGGGRIVEDSGPAASNGR